MSDALNPSGPAQPSLDQVYETSGNPAQKEPAEKAQSQANATSNAPATFVDHLHPYEATSLI